MSYSVVMPLINCPDCERQVSDRASACIHCGCPINAVTPSPKTVSTSTDNFKTELSPRTCPKCNASQGLKTIGSILGNDVSLINTNSLTSGEVFDGATGKLKEEYQEWTSTSGTQNSSLATNILTTVNYWSSRNPDPKRTAEFLDVFTCGACLAVFDKSNGASTLDTVAEQVFIGKSLYGSWRNFFLPIYLPEDALVEVVRHTIYNCKPVGILRSDVADIISSTLLDKMSPGRSIPCYVKEENGDGNDNGPLFYWYSGRSDEDLKEIPIYGKLLSRSLEKSEKRNEKFQASRERLTSLRRVAIQINLRGETGLTMDLFLVTKKQLLSNKTVENDAFHYGKRSFAESFVKDIMKALDHYAIERLNGTPEEEIRRQFRQISK